MAGDETDKKDLTIPSWQQQTAPEVSDEAAVTATAAAANAAPPSDDAPLDLVEHSRRFLDDELVKNSSRERKEAFLKAKGLSDDEIEALLDESESSLKTVHTSSSSPSSSSSTPEPSTSAPESEEPQPSPPSSTSSPSPSPSPPPTSRANDSPPIITYPEFLLKPQKPPPLVTLDRLVNAATVVAGLSALTWGTSKFLVQPLLESLTAARHDLFSTTEQSLETLNSKLESTVSHVPYIPPLHAHHTKRHAKKNSHHDRPNHDDDDNVFDDDDDDDESIASDPTELFHRDIATQTSPQPLTGSEPAVTDGPGPSIITATATANSPAATAAINIADQTAKLAALHTKLTGIVSSTKTSSTETALLETVSNFQVLINTIQGDSTPLSRTRPLSFSNTTTTTASSAVNLFSRAASNLASQAQLQSQSPSPYSSLLATKAAAAAAAADADAAQITRFKAEIRALKGAFLSSRSFPVLRNSAPFTLPTTTNSTTTTTATTTSGSSAAAAR